MIFRKLALERLSSPEQLDQLLRVTDPQGWLALTGLGTLLVVALGWGIWGSIPSLVRGEGILLRQGGVSDLVSAGAGQVEEVLVKVGDVIQKGQGVARIRQDPMLRQIKDSEAKLADMRREHDALARSAGEQKRLRARDLGLQRADLERSMASLGKDIALLEERLGAQRGLLDEGLITKETFLTTQQALNGKRDELARQRLELSGLALKRLEADQQLDQQLETRQAAILDLELKLRETRAQLGENVNIVSPYSGRVLEVLADRGSVVSPGTAVLSVEVLSENLIAVLFVPASEGKRVQRGMAVRVSPSTAKPEQFGAILGQVAWVAEFPSTSRGMVRLLGNEALVAKLMEQGPPIQVNVRLLRDPRAPSGYRWSSSHGPRSRITSGMLVAGDVVVKEDRPIQLVIPTLREKAGF